MTDASQQPTVEQPQPQPRIFGTSALSVALVFSFVSLFLPGFLWRVGRWDMIFAGTGALLLGSLVLLLWNIITFVRSPRRFTGYLGLAVIALALVFWCVVMLVLLRLSNGGRE